MGNEFDIREYLKSITDPEERARTIHESGWSGHPDIEDIERSAACPSSEYLRQKAA
jgi:hypothetical protein